MDLVNRYAAALSLHPTPVEAVGEVAGELLEHFADTRPDLLVCFASPQHVGAFDDIAGGLRKLLDPHVMIGGTAVGVAGGGLEVEDGPGLSVFAASFGTGHLDGFVLDQAMSKLSGLSPISSRLRTSPASFQTSDCSTAASACTVATCFRGAITMWPSAIGSAGASAIAGSFSIQMRAGSSEQIVQCFTRH